MTDAILKNIARFDSSKFEYSEAEKSYVLTVNLFAYGSAFEEAIDRLKLPDGDKIAKSLRTFTQEEQRNMELSLTGDGKCSLHVRLGDKWQPVLDSDIPLRKKEPALFCKMVDASELYKVHMLYTAYKQEYGRAVSGEVMDATFDAYKKDKVAKSFEEYVDEHGFSDGMSYKSFDEFYSDYYSTGLDSLYKDTIIMANNYYVFAVDNAAKRALEAVIYHTHCEKLDSAELESAEADIEAKGEKSKYTWKDIKELRESVAEDYRTIGDWMKTMESLNIPNWLGNAALDWGREHDLRDESLKDFFTKSIYAFKVPEIEEPAKVKREERA